MIRNLTPNKLWQIAIRVVANGMCPPNASVGSCFAIAWWSWGWNAATPVFLFRVEPPL